jgi:hypothetical protein
MSEETQTKGPHSAVTLYVVHHPDCKMAGELAGRLYEWFRLGYQTGDTGSVSIPFWIRCQLSPLGRLNPEIRFQDASLNIVILLSSHEMVLDRDWRKALLDLQIEIAKLGNSSGDNSPSSGGSGTPSQIELLPAVLDDSFYNLTPIYENHNPLRLSHLESDEAKVAVLRRGVLELTARILYSHLDQPEGDFREMRVFLSHAKKDGAAVAEQLRDGIRRFGQLIPWYDANDLAIARGWDKTLQDAMNLTTAGMIAVVTDAYPTRPWCRKELQRARTPLDLYKYLGRPSPGSRVFAIQPVVAVFSLGTSWTRGLATLEGVPRVGWSPVQPLESIEGVVDRLVLEIMLHQVRRKTAMEMAERAQDPHALFLTWVPDGWTMAQLAKIHLQDSTSPARGQAGPMSSLPHRPLTIVYPGVELSPAEKEDLEIELQAFGQGTTLLSYQEWEERCLKTSSTSLSTFSAHQKPTKHLLIALSAGADQREMAEYGLRSEHIDETMVRIVMRVLSAGHRLAFGGTLNNPKHALTNQMIDTTLRWANLKALDGEGVRTAEYLKDPSLWPLVNYSAYPFYNDLEPQKEATWIGFCRIVRVPPKRTLAEADRPLKAECLVQRRDLAKLNADALTRMRKISTRCSDLRIVWGGKVKKAMGWMPGILEEVGFSLEQKKPVLILGALGGCARLIANFLSTPDGEWSSHLSLQSCADSSRDAWLTQAERNELQQRIELYKSLLYNYRNELHGTHPLICGVDRRLLLTALSPNLGTTQILYHVEQFIDEVVHAKAEKSTATMM